MTLLFDSGVILKGEIRCSHFQVFKRKCNKNDAEYICVAVSMREIVSMLPLSVQTVCIVLLY